MKEHLIRHVNRKSIISYSTLDANLRHTEIDLVFSLEFCLVCFSFIWTNIVYFHRFRYDSTHRYNQTKIDDRSTLCQKKLLRNSII